MESAKTEIIKQSATVIPFVLKIAIVTAIGAIVYYKITTRFVEKKEISKYGPANITMAQADAAASNIVASVGLFSTDYQMVASSLAGLNYNGFIRVYNAFGHRTGAASGVKRDMISWLYSVYSDYEMEQLSSINGGAFF